MTAPQHLGIASPAPPEAQGARICRTCGQHFSGDARFCPFDGEPLQVSTEYRPEADPLLGKVIDGRYEVEVVLGEGGMGTVYRARHRALGKRFALKVMRPELARQGDLAGRFIQEARAAAAIDHQNVVQITDFGELPGGTPYFVMELLEGEPLSKILKKTGPLPAVRAVRILQQVAAGLAAAHAGGVVHRDLKPDNIHITPDDVVKVLDFGVAKVAGGARLTRAGMVFGTPQYMSPEQAAGGIVDHRSDIYALGVIMYEMFTGRVPFEADSYMGVLTKHMYMVPELPSRVSESARELGALEDVTMKCLEKKPENRYPTMAAFVEEMGAVASIAFDGSLQVRASATPPPPRAPVVSFGGGEDADDEIPAGVPHSPLVWLFAGVGVAVVAALAFSLFTMRRRAAEVTPVAIVASVVSVAPSVPAAPSVVPTAEASVSQAPSTKPAPRRSVARPAPTAKPSPAPAPTAASPRPSPKPAMGGGEIINPWAK
jgi:serine/threonine-protein kinase